MKDRLTKPGKMTSLAKLAQMLGANERGEIPVISSFRDFLETQAMAKLPGGDYVKYSFEGREALIPIVEVFDLVLGSHTGVPLPDAVIDICGGAQFGKTILALNFGAYLTACRFMNWGYFLPRLDLVEGVVDMKLRPDVIEQIPWLGPLMTLNKADNKNGKSVNRKGAFRVSDGKRKAFGFVCGMDKPPTTFSADVVMEDEKDDIKPKNSKYLTGRMTASEIRLKSSIGTQRLHAAGQQKQWEEGSQGVFLFDVGNGRLINLEENWPQVCRLAVDGEPKPSDPKLTKVGVFMDDEENTWPYDPSGHFYFADPDTGTVVDRRKPILKYLQPKRVTLRRWSFRVSQFAIGALSVSQFVSRWQEAIIDPDSMIVFRCDVMALPANTEQALTPEILTRARTAGAPYDLSQAPSGLPRFAGLDTGNRCWWVTRQIHSEQEKAITWAEQIPLAKVVERATVLFHKQEIDCLAIDANPAVDQARTLCYRLNGLEDLSDELWARFNLILATTPKPGQAHRIEFPGGLVWDERLKRWEGLRCFVVEFNLKPGQGIRHKLGVDDHLGFKKYFPIIEANRFETINGFVNEFLTPEENVIRVVGGKLLEDPVMRLPRKESGSPPAVDTLDAHLLTGSKREKAAEGGEAKDFVDHCENHYVLGGGYSRLAEMEGGHGFKAAPFAYRPVERLRPERRRKGGGL